MIHRVSILRPDDLGDCTAGGVTSPSRTDGRGALAYFPDLGDRPPSDQKGLPVLAVVPGNMRGTVRAVPLINGKLPRIGTAMFGGNFLTTSDSRWGDSVAEVYRLSMIRRGIGETEANDAAVDARYAIGPVPVHDRIE